MGKPDKLQSKSLPGTEQEVPAESLAGRAIYELLKFSTPATPILIPLELLELLFSSGCAFLGRNVVLSRPANTGLLPFF